MTDAKKRVLVLVPNGASTDNRVVREAESLKAAGHDVLLAGLRLSNLPGGRAITANGVDVVRVTWQYAAYSKMAMVYAFAFLPVVAAVLAALLVLMAALYQQVILPLASGVINATLGLVAVLAAGADRLTGGQMRLSTDTLSAQTLREASPILFHLCAIALFLVALMVLKRPLTRLSGSRRGVGVGLAGLPLVNQVVERVRFARNYGQTENVKSYTFLERLLPNENGLLGRLHDGVSAHYIERARTRAFIAIGREFKPDVIHSHEIGTLPASIALKHELGCRVIYDAHEIYDDLANASPAMSKRHRRLHETHLPQLDGFITVNDKIGDYYRATYPAMPTPVIMPNSVYPKDVVYDGRLHEAADLPREAKILLYQGGFAPRRGLELLLEAAYQLPEDWYVVFMGRGNLEKSLRAQSAKLADAALSQYAERQTLLAIASALPPLDSAGDGIAIPDASASISIEALQNAATEKESATLLARMTNAARQAEEVRAQITAENKVRLDVARLRASGKLTKARFVPMAPHSELVEWTSGGTIGAIPYENIGLNHWNCSPNKIWEYPNAGLPLLASRLNYLSHMIQTWNIGWTISSDPSASEIVGAIRGIEARGDLEEKRAACAAFIAADNYTVHERRLLDLVMAV